MFRRLNKWVAALVLVCAFATNAEAQNVVFKIRAINPADSVRTAKISRMLPKGLNPEQDIVDLGGMNLRYDAKRGVHMVETEAELGAKQTRDYVVVVRDIWAVPTEQIEEMKQHTALLTDALSKTSRQETADQLKRQIDETLDQLALRQEKYSVTSVRVVEHIQAYEKSKELLDRARADTGFLENIAVGAGVDPGTLHGLPPPLPERDESGPPLAAEPLRKKIRVMNPASASRTIPIRVYLPSEVLPDDIEPNELLTVRYDSERGACVLTGEAVDVGAGQFVEYDVVISNKWVVDPGWVAGLETRATNLQAATAGTLEGVAAEAERIVKDLNVIMEKEAPTELNVEFIAFYRTQIADFERIEGAILRLEKLLAPRKAQNIFNAEVLQKIEAPNRSSVWIIIYIILGFLATVSLLFFLRWYGKAADEKLAE